MTINVQHQAHKRAERWKLIDQLLPLALRNLNDNHPGYPASAAAGTGSTMSSRDVHSPVESAALRTIGEAAKDDWEELQALEAELDRMYAIERRYVGLVTKWGFQVSEATIHQYKLAATPREEFCSNCLNHGIQAHRYRGDLCRNCYDFDAVEHVLPTREMCETWDRKGRVTTAMVARAKPRKTKSKR